MRFWGAACVLLAFGCGEVSHRDGLDGPSDGYGGADGADPSAGGAAGEPDAADRGSAGALPAGDSGAPASAGSLCSARPPGCDQSATYVDVSDTTTVRLAYDAKTGASSGACEILATGDSNCGTVAVRLSACSAPNGGGVCLDTASSEPHYTDPSGKRWTMLGLSGDAAQLNGQETQGVVDLDLTLGLSSDSTHQDLLVRAHVCASIAATLRPCK